MVAAALGTGLVYYREFADERSIDYAADARVDGDLGRFRPYGLASRLDTQERLNAELDIRAPRIQTVVAAGARLFATPKMGLLMDVRRSSLKFDDASVFDGVLLSHTLNSEVGIIEGGLEFYVTPLTTVSVTASRQQDRFDSAPERDADTFRVMPSVRFEAPAIVEGSLAVGYRRFDGIDPELPDYTGLVFKGTLAHTLLERTRLELLLSRDVEYSFEELQPYYLMTGFRLTVTHQIREAIDARAAVSRENLDYRAQGIAGGESADRRDRSDVFTVGGGYRFRPNLRVGLDFEHARRVSDRAERTYDRSRLLGSFSYGF
jgi:hypothetical protein